MLAWGYGTRLNMSEVGFTIGRSRMGLVVGVLGGYWGRYLGLGSGFVLLIVGQ